MEAPTPLPSTPLTAPVDRPRQRRLGEQLIVGNRAVVGPQHAFDLGGLVGVVVGAEGRDHRLDVHTPNLGQVRHWFGFSPFRSL